MKTIMLTLAAAMLAASTAMAADKKEGKCDEGKCPPRMRQAPAMPGEGMNRGAGPWVAHMLSLEDNLEKIGVENKEQCEKLRSQLKALKKRSSEIEKKVREVSREQAKMMRTFMQNKSCNAEDIYAKIDELAKLRSEQGRISVESMALLRDNLTPEQLKAAQRLIMRGARYRGGREGGPGGERFRRGGRDGEGPRPAMRDGEGPKPEMGDGEGPKFKKGECNGEGKGPRKGRHPGKKRRPPAEDNGGKDSDGQL